MSVSVVAPPRNQALIAMSVRWPALAGLSLVSKRFRAIQEKHYLNNELRGFRRRSPRGLSKTPRQLARSGTKDDVRNAVCSHCRLVRTQALAPRSQCQPLDRCPAFRRWPTALVAYFFPPILSIRKRAPSASNFGGFLCARRVQGRSLPRFRSLPRHATNFRPVGQHCHNFRHG